MEHAYSSVRKIQHLCFRPHPFMFLQVLLLLISLSLLFFSLSLPPALSVPQMQSSYLQTIPHPQPCSKLRPQLYPSLQYQIKLSLGAISGFPHPYKTLPFPTLKFSHKLQSIFPKVCSMQCYAHILTRLKNSVVNKEINLYGYSRYFLSQNT